MICGALPTPLLSSCLLPRAAPLCGHHALHGEERSGVGQKAGELSGVLHQGHLFHRHYWAKRLSSLGLKERKDGATCIFSSDTAEHFASSFDASCFKFSLTATNLLIQPNLLSSRAVPLPKAHLQFDQSPCNMLMWTSCFEDFEVTAWKCSNLSACFNHSPMGCILGQPEGLLHQAGAPILCQRWLFGMQ